jgi:PAS domain S-box-containing protein/putative nucleotidyltransferase with HDIG domain
VNSKDMPEHRGDVEEGQDRAREEARAHDENGNVLKLLKRSEIRYRRLFETAQDGILLLDAETGEITDVNPFLIDLLGYPYDEIAGKKLWEIGPFVDRRAAKQALETLQTEGYIRYEDLPLQTAAGTRIQVEFVSNVYSVDGKDVIQCNIRDITRHRQAEASLDASEERYRTLFNEARDGITLVDAATGTLLDCNDALCRMVERDKTELLGQGQSILHPAKNLDSDELASFQIHCTSDAAELQEDELLSRNGEIVPVEIRAARVQVEGRVCLLAIFRDIRERKEAEAALRASALKYQQVVEGASQAIFVAQGARIVFLNAMTSKMIGHSSEEIMERPFVEFIHPDDRVMVMEKHTSRLRGGDVPPIYGFRIVREDGVVRWVELNAVVINWEGEPATLNFLTDSTERRVADAERERLLKRHLVMNRITLHLGALTDLAAIFRTLHAEIRTLVDADAFFISRYQKDTGLITALFVFGEGVERDASTFTAVPLAPEGKGMQSQVLRSGRPLNVPNWIEGERMMRTVYHIASDGALTSPPAEDDRENCTKSALLVPMMLQGEAVGVLQVQSHRLNAYSDEDVDLLAGVANVAAISIQDAFLTEEVRRGLEGAIEALARTTEMRDPYTAGHQQRVSQLACAIAEKMGLGKETVESLRVSGLLHDIGKISVPAEILSKPTTLTTVEFNLVQEHVRIGFDILKGIVFPWPVAEMILQHHERMDGSGYPRGLKGEAICLEARILAVADVIEAMASHRPYRPALGIDAALQEIREHQGKLYDPDVVEACIQAFGDGFEFTSFVGVDGSP